MEDGAKLETALSLADRVLVDKASKDTAMICYCVLEPEIEEYNSSNDGSGDERSFDKFDQQKQQQKHPLGSQQSSCDSINPSSQDNALG